MELKKFTRYTTAFFLACCSLTLSIQGCSAPGGGNAATSAAPAPKIGIASVELRELVKESERPYVLMNFFATWCRPCRTELPELISLEKDPESEIKVLLVSIDNAADARNKLHDFLAENGVDFQTYAAPGDESAVIAELYPIWDNRIPLSLLFNREGRLLEAITGMTDRSEIELLVNKHKRLES